MHETTSFAHLQLPVFLSGRDARADAERAALLAAGRALLRHRVLHTRGVQTGVGLRRARHSARHRLRNGRRTL